MDNALETLFAPFEKNLVPGEGRVLFLGAQPCAALKNFSRIDCVQTFKPYTAGLDTASLGKNYEIVLCLLPKQVEEAQGMLALGAAALLKGGVLVGAAANDAGGNRIEGWMETLGLAFESLSKNKARAVWGKKEKLSPEVQKWLPLTQPQDVRMGDEFFYTQPGLFSWDRVDAGSRLLVQCLPNDIAGMGADFGCGWGYLTNHVLKKNPRIKKIFCLDADSRALECCTLNNEGAPIEMIWEDLTQPVASLPKLDFIIMNPPFHEGKKTEEGIGQGFIRTASHHLRPGGWLYMVANAHLPYEDTLRECFSEIIPITQKDGFKVLGALR